VDANRTTYVDEIEGVHDFHHDYRMNRSNCPCVVWNTRLSPFRAEFLYIPSRSSLAYSFSGVKEVKKIVT
jgi:hypothetical protein